MTKDTESRLFNELPARGWAKIHAPRHHAVELPDEPGVFACMAWGTTHATATTLEAWAVEMGVEVVFITWVREPESQT